MKSLLLASCLLSFLSFGQTAEYFSDLQGVYVYGTPDPIYLEDEKGNKDSSFAMCNYAELQLYYVNDTVFFKLDACNATYHIGSISGHLNFKDKSHAIFIYEEADDSVMNCYLDFSFLPKQTIHVEEIYCKAWHGHRASFYGDYTIKAPHKLTRLRDEEILNSKVYEFFDYFNSESYSGLKGLITPNCKLKTVTADLPLDDEFESSAEFEVLEKIFEMKNIDGEELIYNLNTNVNGGFASSWMDYESAINGKLSHCGANQINWIRTIDGWRIYEITDIRRKNVCHYYDVAGEEDDQPFSSQILDKEIHLVMNKWHKAAAEADEDVFFPIMAEDCIYLGTDKSERWTKDSFKEFAMPHFQKESAWEFTANWRNIYYTQDLSYVWFEESLETWMGECRGSGVLQRINGIWLLKHYNLSVTIDNDKIKSFIELVKQ